MKKSRKLGASSPRNASSRRVSPGVQIGTAHEAAGLLETGTLLSPLSVLTERDVDGRQLKGHAELPCDEYVLDSRVSSYVGREPIRQNLKLGRWRKTRYTTIGLR